jgi:hypothetical protein
MITGFRSPLFVLGISVPTRVPPPPPKPSGGPGMVVGLPDKWWDAERRYRELQRQNADDLEVIELLTQWLEENEDG